MNVGAKETAACPSRSGRLIRVFRRPLGANISVWRSVVIFFSSAFENFQIPPNKPQKSISDSFYVGNADVRNAAIRKQREVRCYVSSFPIFFLLFWREWKKNTEKKEENKEKKRNGTIMQIRSARGCSWWLVTDEKTLSANSRNKQLSPKKRKEVKKKENGGWPKTHERKQQKRKEKQTQLG